MGRKPGWTGRFFEDSEVGDVYRHDIRLPHPVFAGESLVREKRESGSRPHAGIVSVRTRSLNQHGAEVCSFGRTFSVYKQGAPQIDAFPQPRTPFAED